jgi:hypothetical protein
MAGAAEEYAFDPADLAASAVSPHIAKRDGGRGVRIRDPIEGVRIVFSTPTPVETVPIPSEHLGDRFTFPVSTGAAVLTPSLTIPRRANVWVRDAEGSLVAEASNQGGASVPPGRWCLDVDAGVKLYLMVDAGVRIAQHTHETVMTFAPNGTPGPGEGGRPVEVAIGARSYHSRPAGVVTVPRTPEGVMRGLSTFGTALKTLSPERSFPTLRGHPPLLQFGEEFAASEGITTMETGVTLTVPASYDHVYPLASLAYYLGADVRPGPPAIHAAGREYSLSEVDASARVAAYRPEPLDPEPLARYETAVRDVFRHLFVLDTTVRTVGYYDIPLAERREIEDHLPISLDAAYHAPLAERTAAYLAVPPSVTASAWPRWRLTATAPATADTARYLPFLADDLAMVRTSPAADYDETVDGAGAIPVGDTRGDGTLRRVVRSTFGGWEEDDDIISVPSAPESLTQTWIGKGIPRGASKATLQSYARQISRKTPTEDDARISVAVVCNDPEMREELSVSDIYGARDLLTFDIERYELTDQETLARVFESDLDFVHYIGHVEESGMQCSDGYLSADSLEDVGVESFFLNACRSYRPGQMLVDKGALAGVVTLADVLNKSATLVGSTLARILNAGYPLQLAVDVLGEDLFSAHQYIVVGNGNAELVKAASGTPVLLEVEDAPRGQFDVTFSAYPSHSQGLGSFYVPYIANNRKAYLNTGTLDTFRVTADELEEALTLEDVPMRIPGIPGLCWSDEMGAADIADRLDG